MLAPSIFWERGEILERITVYYKKNKTKKT